MQIQIHPTWYPEAKVTCSCGNAFTLGAAVPEIHVEVCSACHPYYTGQMKFVDTAGRVESFRARQKGAQKKVLSKTDRRKMKRERRINEELSKPDTLTELRSVVKKAKKAQKN